MGVATYFADVARGVKTTVQGMSITFRQMFQRTTTVHYPEEKREYPHSEYTTLGLRGIHGYDVDTCIACFQCANACPVDCIHIEHIHKGKHAIMTRFDIDYQKCLFCHLCVDPCPPHCLWMTEDFDLTGYTREDMVLRLIDWSEDEKQRGLQERSENSQPVKWAKYQEEQAKKEAEEKEQAEAEAKGDAEPAPKEPQKPAAKKPAAKKPDPKEKQDPATGGAAKSEPAENEDSKAGDERAAEGGDPKDAGADESDAKKEDGSNGAI